MVSNGLIRIRYEMQAFNIGVTMIWPFKVTEGGWYVMVPVDSRYMVVY